MISRNRSCTEVSEEIAARVRESFERRGARVHLNTQVVSVVDGHVVLSTGEQFDAHIIVWAAGNGANPVVARHTEIHAGRP
ncbi:FAD-dependent oxidoreductase [Occallatibacter riparius]|uniref:FAD-dependent oxidoreductase n=1 Tax=Occallatibacter riparius TaxID=1002689 RepID=UPI0036F3DEC4